MTTKILLAPTYHVTPNIDVELPNNKQWEDVKDIGIRWNTAWFQFKDGTEWETELDDEATQNAHDFKRPDEMQVFREKEDGTFEELKLPEKTQS
jgi:hypothetical protein